MQLVINVNTPSPSPAPGTAEVSEIISWSSSLDHDFKALVSRWRDETAILSSVPSKVFNKSYQSVMAKGPEVLPLIFKDLLVNGGYWYWALECITGDNPAESSSNIAEAKQAWLEYAVRHGYLNANRLHQANERKN